MEQSQDSLKAELQRRQPGSLDNSQRRPIKRRIFE
jgi:hypothetical protein